MKQLIQENLKSALKEGDAVKTGTLRMLLAAIVNKEKEKRYKVSKAEPKLSEQELQEKSELSAEEIQEVVSSEAKKRREAIEGFEKGGRTELAEKEKKEMAVLQSYLPEQLSEDEIRKFAKEAIGKVGAPNLKDMGKVMAELMPKLKGKADGAMVNKIVRELLS